MDMAVVYEAKSGNDWVNGHYNSMNGYRTQYLGGKRITWNSLDVSNTDCGKRCVVMIMIME